MKSQTNYAVFSRSYDNNIDKSKIHLIGSVFSYPSDIDNDSDICLSGSKLDDIFTNSPDLFNKLCLNNNYKFIILRFIDTSSITRSSEDLIKPGIGFSVIYEGSYVIEIKLTLHF